MALDLFEIMILLLQSIIFNVHDLFLQLVFLAELMNFMLQSIIFLAHELFLSLNVFEFVVQDVTFFEVTNPLPQRQIFLDHGALCAGGLVELLVFLESPVQSQTAFVVNHYVLKH